MDLPGYDAWKLDTPPYCEMTAEEERKQEAERKQAIADAEYDLQGAVEDIVRGLEKHYDVTVRAIHVDTGSCGVTIVAT